MLPSQVDGLGGTGTPPGGAHRRRGDRVLTWGTASAGQAPKGLKHADRRDHSSRDQPPGRVADSALVFGGAGPDLRRKDLQVDLGHRLRLREPGAATYADLVAE